MMSAVSYENRSASSKLMAGTHLDKYTDVTYAIQLLKWVNLEHFVHMRFTELNMTTNHTFNDPNLQ
jgi:hypothetical protein